MMEIANTFATLVGLLAVFKEERKGARDERHADFLEWLEYHRHGELVRLVKANSALQTELNAVLRSDTTQILKEIQSMNQVLLKMGAEMRSWNGLVNALAPSQKENTDAFRLLKELVRCQITKVSVHTLDVGTTHILCIDGKPKEFSFVSDFIRDDVHYLLTRGYLLQEASHIGTIYVLTRAGHAKGSE